MDTQSFTKKLEEQRNPKAKSAWMRFCEQRKQNPQKQKLAIEKNILEEIN